MLKGKKLKCIWQGWEQDNGLACFLCRTKHLCCGLAFLLHDNSLPVALKLQTLETGFQSVAFSKRNLLSSCVNQQSGKPVNAVMSWLFCLRPNSHGRIRTTNTTHQAVLLLMIHQNVDELQPCCEHQRRMTVRISFALAVVVLLVCAHCSVAEHLMRRCRFLFQSASMVCHYTAN